MSLEAHVYNVSRFFFFASSAGFALLPIVFETASYGRLYQNLRVVGYPKGPIPRYETRNTQQRIRPYLFSCFSSPPVEIIRILMSLFSVFTRHYIETKKGRVRRVLKTGSLRWVVFIGLPRDRQAGGHSR